jgi:hypothetical protein
LERNVTHDLAVLLKGFPGGPPKTLVSAEALTVLWKLEDAGHDIRRVDGQLMITPKGSFTRVQTDYLAAHRGRLTQIVRYVERLDRHLET